MKRLRIYLLLSGLVTLGCTAYIDPPRQSLRTSEMETEISLRYPLQVLSRISSLAVDRAGNAGYTESAGWILASAGWDGSEIFRINLSHPRDALMPGGADGYWLLNDLDRRIKHYDSKGQNISQVSFSGISASTGAVTLIGEIYLLDGVNSQVKVIGPDGYELRSFHIEGPDGLVFRPTAIALDPSRNLLALSDPRAGKVMFYNLYGTKHGSLSVAAGNHPQSIGFDYLGRLWICLPEQNAVAVYSSQEAGWAERKRIALQKPYAVVLSPFGSGVVAEEGNLVFLKF